MFYRQLRKSVAVLCVLLTLGAAACKSVPTEDSLENPTGEKKESEELTDAIIRNQTAESAERTATVKLSDTGAEITGSGCEMEGNRLKIKKAGVYEISGTLSNGSIYVNVENESEVHLILNGVSVHNETSAALFCKKAAKVTITLAEGSVNRFSDGATYVFEEGEDEPDSTIYAKHDLVVDGTGKLVVTSSYGDALKGKDCLYLLGGEITVKSADDGIVGRDLLYIAEGTYVVESVGDALKASNDTDVSLGNMVIDGGSFVLMAETDGIQAENTLTINDGTFTVKTGGGSSNATEKKENFGFGGGGGRGFGDWGNWGQTTEPETEETSFSAKGLKAGVLLAVNGGRFEFDTCDDALHGNTDVAVTGGDFTIMTGDDGMHADETLWIEGNPNIRITKGYEGLEGLEIEISGGDIDITVSDDGLNAAGGNDGSGFGGRGFGGQGFGGQGFGNPGMGMFGGGEGEITVNGGTIRVNAGGDGIDSNGALTVNGGTITVFGSTNGGEGALDYDGAFCLNGGTVLAAGGSAMGLTPANTSGQYSLVVGFRSQEQAGSKVEIVVSGETVFSEEVPKQFNYIVASSKEFVKDAEVSVAVNGKVCHEGTLSDVVTAFGSSGGMGGFGGGMPQWPEGEMPGGFGGGMPQWPNREWPGFSEGEMPQMPEGGMWPGFDV